MKRSFYIGGKKIDVITDEDTSIIIPLDHNINIVPELIAQSAIEFEFKPQESEIFYDSEEIIESYKNCNCHIIKNSVEFKEKIEELKVVKKINITKPISIDGKIIGSINNNMNIQLNQSYSEKKCRTILKKLNIEIILKVNFADNLYYVDAPTWEDAMYASEDLHNNEDFIFAEPTIIENFNIKHNSSNSDNILNIIDNNSELYHTEQWYLKNTGEIVGDKGVDMNVIKAWELTKGENINVAVIDYDFDINHDDLKNSLLSSSIHYMNKNDGNPPYYESNGTKRYYQKHGTQCAGIISARKYNENGLSGIAPESKLLLIGCFDNGFGTQLEIAQAIDYALSYKAKGDNVGIDIISCSLGVRKRMPWILSDCLNLSLNNTVTTGKEKNYVPIFWAANNSGSYDIKYDQVVSHPNVIGVVSSNYFDQSSQTAFGGKVELSAPGQRIYSILPDNKYGNAFGNSFAAPCAAGCAALVISSTTNSITGQEVRQILKDSAKKIETSTRIYTNGHNDYVGYGRVDAFESVQQAKKYIN